MGAGPRDLNSHKQLAHRAHVEKDHTYHVDARPRLTCDGKVKVGKEKAKVLGKNAEALGCPRDEYAPFLRFLEAFP